MQIFSRLKIVFFILVIGLFVGACSTPQSKALSRVQVGMDKADVLEIVGNPDRKGREHNQDVWIYEPKAGDSADISQETTYIYFSSGKVTYAGPKSATGAVKQ